MPQAYLLKSVMKVVRGADSSCIVSAKILMSCLICETLLYLLVVPECHPPPVVHGFDAVIEFCKIYAYSDFTIRFWDGSHFPSAPLLCPQVLIRYTGEERGWMAPCLWALLPFSLWSFSSLHMWMMG